MKPKTLLLSVCILIINCQLSIVNSSAQGAWSQKANFGGAARELSIGFSIGTKGYIGTGQDGLNNYNDFWEWNSVTNAWTQKADFSGVARQRAVGFSIGTKGYIGTGTDGPNTYQDFWEWDQSTNVWTQKANFGGTIRLGAVGFFIGTKGYIGTGYDGNAKQDFWEYNPSNDTWTQKTNFGGTARLGAVGFSIGTKGYIGIGMDASGLTKDFWEYNSSNDTWTQKTNFGGKARWHAIGFSLGAKGYIGTGDTSLGVTKDLWEWDQAGNIWKQVANVVGTARHLAVGFSVGTKGYIGTGNDGINNYNDFWQFTPVCNLNLAITTTNSSCGMATGTASVVATNGTAPYTYAWTNGDKTSLADTLAAGLYMVTVTDASGCTDTKAAMVSDAGAPTITVPFVKDVSCYGGNDGAVAVTAAGGSPPYNYLWGNGATTQSISNVQAGPHQVQVTDANGCMANKIIVVNEPANISLSDSIRNATCGNADGVAAVLVSGGTSPYTYSWSTGATTQVISNLAVGGYSVLVTDSNGCTKSGMDCIINLGAAIATVDSIISAKCGIGTGSVYISVTGGTPPYTYLWNNSATTEDITNVPPGNYGVTIYSNGNSCTGALVVNIPSQIPSAPVICIVTVDTATGKNQCVFVKDSIANAGLLNYNFYRETTTAGVYQLLGSKPANLQSIWTDQSANPLQRAWRYKVTAVDTCGKESPLSGFHKTIHLAASLGLNNTVNLMWDNYEGISFGTFIIYRYDPVNGWDSLDAVPSNLNSYTDLSPPTLINLHYFVAVPHPFGCTATLANPDNEDVRENPITMATNLNTSRSNIYKINSSTTSVNEFNVQSSMLQVYPNPSVDGEFTVYSLQFPVKEIEVYNIYGEKIYQTTVNRKQETVNLSSQHNGIYFLQVKSEEGVITKKIILQK